MDYRASIRTQARGLSGAWLSAVIALSGCIYKAPIGDDGRDDASADSGQDAASDGGGADAMAPRTCTNDSQCGAGEQCLGGEGCAVPWTCQAFVGDRICTADYGPFCGCDGVTIYGSSSCPPGPFAYRGECRGGPVDAGVDSGPTDAGPPVDAGDGGARACSADADCPRGYSCSGPEGCGTEWTCQPNPGGAEFRPCTADYAPFCGCDGVTIYGSSTCPPGRFAYRGECRDGGAPVDAGADGGAPVDAGEPDFCPRALCAAGTTCCEAARRCVAPGEPCEAPAACVRTGCSGQLCAETDVGSTCEWRDAYACYRTAECKRQADGRCGWTDTTELRACLARSP